MNDIIIRVHKLMDIFYRENYKKPQTIVMSVGDYYELLGFNIHKENIPTIYGMKIIKTHDLSDGDFFVC
jgi:hypothetical protein